jgi:DNA-binding NarL/FixJ family response regulator
VTGPWRTVIVDDAPDVRWIVRALLSRNEAYELVGEAEDGAAGLEMILRERPDLVLLDLSMPVMDGLEVLAALGPEVAETTVVVLSGFAARLNSAAAVTAGAAGYVEKRNLVDSLISSLGGVLDGRVPAQRKGE